MEKIDSKEKIYKINSIEFKNVYFKYPNSKHYVIENCNFKINSNEKIAFLGLNGAGKTTITKLILGLYKASSGEILINDKNIDNINLSCLFDNISYIEQETNLMSMTIKEFITSRFENIDEDKVIKSLKDANILDKINSFEKGINSTLTKYLDKSGINLSGGEMQKLFIARALYRNSSLYIFDEPTSALDVVAEKNLYTKFSEISKNNIAIFISHKLKTTTFCDKIFIVQNGKIIESGTEEELLNLRGIYSKLINLDEIKEDLLCE